MFRQTPSENELHDYVEPRLSAYIDGQLAENERARVRQHLQTCTRCQASLNSLGWTVKLLKQTPAPALPRQFTLPVGAPSRVPAGTSPGWLGWGLRAGAAIAAVAFVILLTVTLLSPQNNGSLPPTNIALAPTTAPAADSAHAPTTAAQPTSAPIPTLVLQPTTIPPAPSQPAATAALPSEFAVRTGTPPRVTGKSFLVTPTPSCIGCGGANPNAATPANLPLQAETVPEVPTATGRVNASALIVRVGPSEDLAQIGLLPRGSQVQIFGRDDTGAWLEILFPRGADEQARGWIAAAFVRLTVPVNSLPLAPTFTPTPTETPTPTPISTETPTPSPTD